MSEEEKQAIEGLECFEPDDLFECALYRNCIAIIKNLIEKQQKEIEELKNKYSDEEIRNTVIKRCNEIIEKDYISKDKIREKIKELEKEKEEKQEYGLDCTLIYEHEIDTNGIIRVLQELLGEK